MSEAKEAEIVGRVSDPLPTGPAPVEPVPGLVHAVTMGAMGDMGVALMGLAAGYILGGLFRCIFGAAKAPRPASEADDALYLDYGGEA